MTKIQCLERELAETKRLRKLAEGQRQFDEADGYYRRILRLEGMLEEARREEE